MRIREAPKLTDPDPQHCLHVNKTKCREGHLSLPVLWREEEAGDGGHVAVQPRLKLKADLGRLGRRLLQYLVHRDPARLVAQPQASYL
jgi:hypothetical protein